MPKELGKEALDLKQVIAENPVEKTELGTIVSTFDSPSPSKIAFVVNNGIVHRGQFIELTYSEGTLMALVTNVLKTNRYFERAESVKEFESNGTKLHEQFPVGEWEFLVAEAKPLAVFSEAGLKRSTFPPSPGTRVKIANSENLFKFLGLKENGLNVGKVEYHSIPMKLDLNRLIGKHLAILGISGSGKSVSSNVVIEELLLRSTEFGRIAALLFDAHGEYVHLANPIPGNPFSHQVKVVSAEDIQIAVHKLNAGNMAALVPSLTGIQKRELDKALEKLKQEMKDGLGPFDLKELKNAILNDADLKENTKTPLLSAIYELEHLHLFGKLDQPAIDDLLQPGQLTVVDLSSIVNMKKKQSIVSFYLHKLFYDRRMGKVPPFVTIIEEAHAFAPERVKAEHAVSKPIIETIAREGRKFLACLCLISQRPIQLSTTALSQCNSHLIHRVTNPYDLDHIGKSSEGLDRNSLDMISSLRVGEALLVGEAVNFPVFFKVRNKTSKASAHEIKLDEAAKQFELKHAEKQKETEGFL